MTTDLRPVGWWQPPDLTGIPIGTPGYTDLPMLHTDGQAVTFPPVLTVQASLFPDAGPTRPPPPQPPKVSPGRRRTNRQHQLLADGIHPLTRRPVHPEAPTDSGPLDHYIRAFTCGSCLFKLRMEVGKKTVLKCGWTPEQDEPTVTGPRVTGSVASDLHNYWAACDDYQPGDGTLNP